MNPVRPTRSALRRFQPLIRPQCTHTSGVTRIATQPWIVPRNLSSLPRRTIVPTSRLFSHLAAARQEANLAGDAAAAKEGSGSEDRWANTPAYEMTFTCKQCNTRSSHKISKQGYHNGTVLITCPGCKNRHLIADHLKIFSDTRVTLEDIMKEKGQLVKRGTLSAEGDVEFWDDGTEVKREAKDNEEGKS